MNTNNLSKNKVLLGVSGGVDSTVAALLLLEKGYDVYGLHFDISGNGRMKEEAANRLREAYRSAGKGALPEEKFIYIDAGDDFESTVIADFCEAYQAGRTPNPCVLCNPTVKFRYLIEEANRIGAYHIATGHYASTYYDRSSDVHYVRKSLSKKDQSYMLCRLTQEQIARVIFPLEHMENKSATREIANTAGLSNANLKDSQELCFIDDNENYINFLKARVTSQPGDFIDTEGNVIGRHNGIINYTIGQRKGLGITFGKPVFVTAIDAENNTVTLGSNEDLFTDRVTAAAAYFPAGGTTLPEELRGICLSVKLRYTANPAAATVTQNDDGKIVAQFKEKQRAATPGQSLVIYKDDLLVGCGCIE